MAIHTDDSALASARSRDELLATKLFVPRAPPAFVSRRRLHKLLDEGFTRGLIVVAAPAGSGKSSLLADWVRASAKPTAWMSLDETDSDPSRFWRQLVAALEPMRPTASRSLSDLLSGTTTASPDVVATRLINTIATAADDLVLVLDDYDRIEDPAITRSVQLLVERRPPGLCVAIAGRADPLLPLARLRARGQLIELRAGDLRFTTDESGDLLAQSTGDDLEGRLVATLTERTEGWAAGLALAGLSMRGHADPSAFVENFSGSHRYVLDYLAGEVLDRQPPDVRQFLLETSILGRLSAPVCNALTDQTDSQALLEQLERENLFVIPLDDVRGWWRYHHLFADLLRARLALELPGRAADLHAVAARWHLDHGLGDAAFHHALAAGDAPLAALVVETHFDEAFLAGERVTIERWLDALPLDLARSRPRLGLARAFMAVATGQLSAIAGPLDDAERALPTWDDGVPFTPTAGPDASWLADIPTGIRLGRALIGYLHGDADAAADHAAAVLEMTSDGHGWMLASLARWSRAMADRLRGDLVAAEQGLIASADEWMAADQPSLAAVSNHHLGDVRREQGRLSAAQQAYEEMLALQDAGGVGVRAGVAHLGLADVAYERNELESALEHLSQGIELCRLLNYTQPIACGLSTLALVRLATGNVAGAVAAIEEAEGAAPDSTIATVVNPVPVRRARLHLARGQLNDAIAWADARGLDPNDHPPYAREPEYVMLARILIAAGHPEQALPLLDRLREAAERQGRIGCQIEIGVVRALAQAATGADRDALDALQTSLALRADEGWTRVFLDEGRPMIELCTRLVADSRSVDERAVAHARLLLASVGAAQPGAVAIPGSPEALTPREVDVLELVAAGHSNQAIAEELFVTLDTVKKHLTHILGKLGAANRTEAAMRARELGLLSDRLPRP